MDVSVQFSALSHRAADSSTERHTYTTPSHAFKWAEMFCSYTLEIKWRLLGFNSITETPRGGIGRLHAVLEMWRCNMWEHWEHFQTWHSDVWYIFWPSPYPLFLLTLLHHCVRQKNPRRAPSALSTATPSYSTDLSGAEAMLCPSTWAEASAALVGHMGDPRSLLPHR